LTNESEACAIIKEDEKRLLICEMKFMETVG